MSARRVVAALALLAGLLLLTASTYRRREFQRWLDEETASPTRYVDAHVRLHVVAKDPEGKETNPAKLKRLRTHELGGWIDTQWSPPRLMPECEYGEGQDWYCSEEQEKLAFHADDAPIGKLALGGMGAGKTSAGVIWVYLRWLESIDERTRLWTQALKAAEETNTSPTSKPIEGGITAPTAARLKIVIDEITAKFPAPWFHFSSTDSLFTMCDGSLVRCVSTYRQSASQGSRLQGFNWAWWLGDELQDQLVEYIHIIARLRSKADGRAKRLATATEKDSPEWRTFKASLFGSGDWVTHSMLGPRSPFIAQAHWDSMKRQLTERNYRRLVLAEDMPSEGRVYFGWDRTVSLRPLPLGAKKITSLVLGKKTGDQRHALLAGHDPGSLKGATIYLDAYEIRGIADPVWWVRGETLHKRQTTQRSARDILAHAKKQGLNVQNGGSVVHVRAMPVGQSEDNPSEDLYRIFRAEGLDVRASQYRKDGTGTGVIKKEDRIEVVNWLFESGRLFVECDDRGRPVAPKLVEALEMLERDHRGKAESGPKNESDITDCPAALGYALWPFEKSSSSALRDEVRAGIGVG